MAVDEARDGNVAAAVDLAPGPGQAGRRADVRDQPVTDADRPRLDAILGDDLRVPNARAP